MLLRIAIYLLEMLHFRIAIVLVEAQ